MNRIDKVIFDALARRQSVYLPEVGYLEVRRRKARKISETRIIPPQNVVVFTLDEIADAASAVSLLMVETIVDGTQTLEREDAHKLYNEWLAAASTEEGVLRIAGVGLIKDGKMVETAANLQKTLNPDNEAVVTMEKENKNCNCATGTIVAWVLVGVLALVILIGGICWWMHRDAIRAAMNGGAVENVEIIEQIVEFPGEAASELGESDVDQAQGTECGSGSEAAATSSAAASAAKSGGAYHVIAGTFSIESNADNLIKKIRKNYPELNPEKIVQPSSGYWMVSIIDAPTAREAYNQMNKYWDIDLYLWVYKD